MPDVSIMVSAQDNFSTAVNRMQQAVKPFTRDVDGLQQTLDQLNANRVSLQVDVTDASRVLRPPSVSTKTLQRKPNEPRMPWITPRRRRRETLPPSG